MQAAGAASSARKAADEKSERDRIRLESKAVMPRDVVIAAQALVRELLAAKIANTWPPETDVRKAVVGAFVAAHLYAPPDDRTRLAHALLPHDIRARADVADVAEDELRGMIESLEPTAQSTTWEMLNAGM